MSSGAVVLVVEDDDRFHAAIKAELLASGLVQEVVVVESLAEVVGEFEKIKNTLSAVLMDACLHEQVPDTLVVTKHIRANFRGVMVAMSRDRNYRQEQLAAGCDHESPKYKAAEYLLGLLAAKNVIVT